MTCDPCVGYCRDGPWSSWRHCRAGPRRPDLGDRVIYCGACLRRRADGNSETGCDRAVTVGAIMTAHVIAMHIERDCQADLGVCIITFFSIFRTS